MVTNSSSGTILTQRARLTAPEGIRPSPTQARADALVSSFVDHATDGYALAGMVGGGLVYRLGRLGTLAVGSRLFGVGARCNVPLRLFSTGVGFTGEVFTFEAGQRALRVGIGGADPNLLRFSGENGLGRGLVGAAITLGPLKGAGVFAQGQNIVVQHLFQDSAMVLAHNVSDRIFTRRGEVSSPGRGDPAPTIAEQLIHAEATLWQMNAGMSLVHGAFPRLGQLDRGLDLLIRSRMAPSPALWALKRLQAPLRSPSPLIPPPSRGRIKGGGPFEGEGNNDGELLWATPGNAGRGGARPRALSDLIFAMSPLSGDPPGKGSLPPSPPSSPEGSISQTRILVPRMDGGSRNVSSLIPTLKVFAAQDAYWLIDTITDRTHFEADVFVEDQALPPGGSLRVQHNQRIRVGREVILFKEPELYWEEEGDAQFGYIPGNPLHWKRPLSRIYGTDHYFLMWQPVEELLGRGEFLMARGEGISMAARVLEKNGDDFSLELSEGDHRARVRLQIDSSGFHVRGFHPASESSPLNYIFLDWLMSQAWIGARRMQFSGVTPFLIDLLSFGLINRYYSFVDVIQKRGGEPTVVARGHVDEFEALWDLYSHDCSLDLHTHPNPLFMPSELGQIHRRAARQVFDRWSEGRFGMRIPTLVELDEGQSLPDFNHLGVDASMDSILSRLILHRTRFLEIGYGQRIETLQAVENRGGLALGLEVEEVYPPGTERQAIESGEVDVLFVNGSPFLFYANHLVSLPAAADILRHFARTRWVVIQAYNPITPFEILRHAEEINQIRFEPLYYRAASEREEKSLFPSDWTVRPDTAHAVLIARRIESP